MKILQQVNSFPSFPETVRGKHKKNSLLERHMFVWFNFLSVGKEKSF